MTVLDTERFGKLFVTVSQESQCGIETENPDESGRIGLKLLLNYSAVRWSTCEDRLSHTVQVGVSPYGNSC